jgi:hypothetical protein
MVSYPEIPENISYVYYPEIRERKGYLMMSAFPVDSNNKERMATAKCWAEQHYQSQIYDQKQNTYINNPEPPKEICIDEFKNAPITGIKIIDLECRSQGGRAYKVALPNRLVVDLREDVLLETIMKVGILPGGILNGEFIWCRDGGETKLVLIGSKLHKEMLNLMQYRNKENVVKKDDLILGQLYETSDKYIIYCGKAYTLSEKGQLIERECWISTEKWRKRNNLADAIETFTTGKLSKHGCPYFDCKIGNFPVVKTVESTTGRDTKFENLANLLPDIIETEREEALKNYKRQVNYYYKNINFNPSQNYSYYGSRNHYEKNDIKCLTKETFKLFEQAFASIKKDKKNCIAVHVDFENLLQENKNKTPENWKPTLVLTDQESQNLDELNFLYVLD